MITVYGLKNCDTCRKAIAWLKDQGRDHEFRDVRPDGVSADRIAQWSAAVGWETLLNRRGTTWRTLDDEVKQGVGETAAIALMTEHPALIKRPVFEVDDAVLVGFKDDVKMALSDRRA